MCIISTVAWRSPPQIMATQPQAESRHPADFTPFFPDMMSKYQAVNDGQYSGRPGGN